MEQRSSTTRVQQAHRYTKATGKSCDSSMRVDKSGRTASESNPCPWLSDGIAVESPDQYMHVAHGPRTATISYELPHWGERLQQTAIELMVWPDQKSCRCYTKQSQISVKQYI